MGYKPQQRSLALKGTQRVDQAQPSFTWKSQLIQLTPVRQFANVFAGVNVTGASAVRGEVTVILAGAHSGVWADFERVSIRIDGPGQYPCPLLAREHLGSNVRVVIIGNFDELAGDEFAGNEVTVNWFGSLVAEWSN